MKFRKLADLQRDIETLEGSWELSPQHEVIYRERRDTLRPGSGPREWEATFKGSLVAAEPDALVMSVTTKEDETHSVTGLVKLSGKWALDEKNRITFLIKKPFGGAQDRDKLTFQGAWEINDNFQVTYTFTTQSVLEESGKARRRTPKITQELVFEGHWDISDKNRLTYLIGSSSLSPLTGRASKEQDSDSAFRFRGTFETSSIAAKKGEIRYQAGIEYKTARGAKKRLTRTIILFGKWKFSDDLALSFEIEYPDGRRAEIRLGADLSLKRFQGSGLRRLLPDEVSVDLTSAEGKPLGIELVLTKELFDGNAQTFVRFQRSIRERGLEAGIKMQW